MYTHLNIQSKMKKLINSVRLVGHVGADPEIKTFENGGRIMNVKMATNEPYKNKAGEWEDNTNWHSLVFKGKMVDYAEKIIAKGEKISLEGRLTQRDYTDKAGQKRYITEVEVNELMRVGEKKKEGDKLPF